jgi:hypothetical protein
MLDLGVIDINSRLRLPPRRSHVGDPRGRNPSVAAPLLQFSTAVAEGGYESVRPLATLVARPSPPPRAGAAATAPPGARRQRRLRRGGGGGGGGAGPQIRDAPIRLWQLCGRGQLRVRGGGGWCRRCGGARDGGGSDGGGGGLRGGMGDDVGATTAVRESTTTSAAAGAGWLGGSHGRPWPAQAVGCCLPRPGVVAGGFLRSPSSVLHVWRPMEGARGGPVCDGGAEVVLRAVLGLFWWRWRGAGYERAADMVQIGRKPSSTLYRWA